MIFFLFLSFFSAFFLNVSVAAGAGPSSFESAVDHTLFERDEVREPDDVDDELDAVYVPLPHELNYLMHHCQEQYRKEFLRVKPVIVGHSEIIPQVIIHDFNLDLFSEGKIHFAESWIFEGAIFEPRNCVIFGEKVSILTTESRIQGSALVGSVLSTEQVLGREILGEDVVEIIPVSSDRHIESFIGSHDYRYNVEYRPSSHDNIFFFEKIKSDCWAHILVSMESDRRASFYEPYDIIEVHAHHQSDLAAYTISATRLPRQNSLDEFQPLILSITKKPGMTLSAPLHIKIRTPYLSGIEASGGSVFRLSDPHADILPPLFFSCPLRRDAE